MDIAKPRPPKPTAARMPALALAAIACLAAFGCREEKTQATVLAQVGDASLTLEELRESFPVEFEQLIRREQYLDFIKRWMDDEVIYQQAVKAKIDSDPIVKRKLDKVRRKLLIEEYLAKENAAEVFEPDEIAMNQYYEMHKEDFRRAVPEVKFVHIRAETNRQALDLRYKANRGDFLTVAESSSLDPVPESYASIAFKKLSEAPPCLTRQISEAEIGSVTSPIACPDGFYVVKVLERQDAGSLISLSEAKEEISGILAMERKDKLLESRIAKYKENVPVSYNLEQIPGLSEELKPAPVSAVPESAAATVGAPATGAAPAAAPVSALPAKVPPKPAPPAAAPKLPTVSPAAAPARMPREPAAQTVPREPAPMAAPKEPASATVPGEPVPATTPAAPAPRLPREPWEDSQKVVPDKRKSSGRSGAAPDGDSLNPRPAVSPQAAEPLQETSGNFTDEE